VPWQCSRGTRKSAPFAVVRLVRMFQVPTREGTNSVWAFEELIDLTAGTWILLRPLSACRSTAYVVPVSVPDYLSERRRDVSRVYHYSYSDLDIVFSRLMRDGWLTEADLAGLRPEKIADIKRGAEVFR
jgi:hypothetical protein